MGTSLQCVFLQDSDLITVNFVTSWNVSRLIHCTERVDRFLTPSPNVSNFVSVYVNKLEMWESTGVIAEGRWGLARAAAQPLGS